MAIDRNAPLRFLGAAYAADDWVAVLLKSHDTGTAAQRVGPVSLIAHPRFQGWLRAQNVRRSDVYIGVNAIRRGRRARTRDAIGGIRHVFLDADQDGAQVLEAIEARRDLPVPSYVLHSSKNRVHVLWRAVGFTRESVENLQKQLARELGTDKAATSCAQLTRLPGFANHKYRPAPVVLVRYADSTHALTPADFPTVQLPHDTRAAEMRTARRTPADTEPFARARRYLTAIPPAVAGQGGDSATFRVCCRLVRGFALDDDDALAALVDWNQRCVPPWSETDLRLKLRSARRSGRELMGGLLQRRT